MKHLPRGALGAVALVSLLMFVGDTGYYAAAYLGPILKGREGVAFDFSVYREAAARFLEAPATLYAARGSGDIPLFLYPPPCILAFLPFARLPESLAYASFSLVVLASLVLATRLILRTWERDQGQPLPSDVRIACYLFALGSAPAFQNLKLGQVNTLVLLACVCGLALLGARRPVAAGTALSVGIWLKVYPIALALLAIREPRRRALLGGLVLGLIGVPLLALPVVPGMLYRQYILDVLPSAAGVTSLSGLNQSLAGVIARWSAPAEAAASWDVVVMSPPATWATRLVAAVAIIAIVLWMRSRARPDLFTVGALTLALVPIVSPFGWEHAYVLSIPLLLLMVREMRGAPAAEAIVPFAALVLFLIPKLPNAVLMRGGAVPPIVAHAFHARFIIGSLIGALWLARRAQPSGASNALATSARSSSLAV